MKEIKSAKKTSVLKKFFIKICRLLGYELIDQSTLEFPVSNKNYSSSVSIPGKKSLSLGSGETLITRKVEGIEIIILKYSQRILIRLLWPHMNIYLHYRKILKDNMH